MSDRTETSPADGRGVEIDPARLASGQWCHRRDRMIGEGDIHASYSADRIGMSQPIRKPFGWHGGQWVCVSISGRQNRLSASAYRLIHQGGFDGVPVSYRAKTLDSDAARADANGFYHGMTVTQAGKPFVLIGPPVMFTPGKADQLSLF
jgi:hypothetical protein